MSSPPKLPLLYMSFSAVHQQGLAPVACEVTKWSSPLCWNRLSRQGMRESRRVGWALSVMRASPHPSKDRLGGPPVRAYSPSLTLVPRDLVRNGGFTTQHRQGEENSRKETATATATTWDLKTSASYPTGTRSSSMVTRCRLARPKFLSSKQVRLPQPALLYRTPFGGVVSLSLALSCTPSRTTSLAVPV